MALLKSCDHQAGGHKGKGHGAAMCVDDEGRIYKPFQSGPRSEREVQFYKAVFETPENGLPRAHAAHPLPEGDSPPEPDTVSSGPADADVEGIKPFLPRFDGVVEIDGKKFVVLQDLCKGYAKPCVLDCKMGFTTAYDWADEAYRNKNKIKDAQTSQSSAGFRISGMQVFRNNEVIAFKAEREWCKDLTKDTIGTVFTLAASNGTLSVKDLFCHPELGALVQLRQLEAWAQRQTSFQFFQSSVLFMYDGAAKGIEEAKVRVALVDFAHTFRTVGGARDDNLLLSITSLISIIEGVAATSGQ